MKKLLTFILIVCAPFVAFAHEGHGLVQEGPVHYVFSPEHYWAAGLLVAFIGFILYVRHKKSRV